MENLKLTRIPPGLRLFPTIQSTESRAQIYRASVLLLTFVAYALLHASRKPPSVAKNVLASSDSLHSSLYITNSSPSLTWPLNMMYQRRLPLNLTQSRPSLKSGWAPFDGTSGTALLGDVDVAFLASYSIGMYIAGHLGDRLDLRWFLSGGMVGSGMIVCLFGLAYWWNVHWLGYFLIVQILGGFVQATGWPSVVSIIGNWFGKSKRGLIMGVWNAHTSIGNIWGTLMASSVLKYGWGWSFVVPGCALIAGGIVMFLFLVVDPKIVGLASPYDIVQGYASSSDGDEERGHPESKEVKTKAKLDWKKQPLLGKGGKSLENYEEDSEHSPVGFFQAWAIPRVAQFAFSLFFAKLVAYTFLYWLPYYIEHTEINGEYLSDTTAGNLSTLFDVGGTLGGILAGYISDKLNARAIVAASFTYAALPMLLLYRMYGSEMFWLNALLLFLAGICVNGPYALITTAVAADLGTHESLKGSSKALATVTAIIDGTGSVGAAVGPLITGYISKTGWNSVFIMLILSATISGLLITGLVIEELKELSVNWRSTVFGKKELE
ncbi:hypothetical protein GOP47_0007244 [Adiantum capillus-veneris]|uniref:Major facilitator superfamily (MFS) profile domain-containing protein n=1 Tax=Adiantum capillus-veneris TaxID=13818 RepID=A0A9D4V0Y2_ADICA|nr:hypothetical protein GOP47_0007244 [Adiantum capillus-veneris]